MAQARLSVFYPATEGAPFDHDYYRDVHIPLCETTWSPLDIRVERGISGPHVAAVHFTFSSMDELNAALGSPGTKALGEDTPNYTTLSPAIQIGEVVR
ncbi:EthD family reductase [Frankia sp. AgB32]|uniref:EthD family reductase n=1 Tax=Frankia sp. AgB32 TaxID=631119 RepID=UPI00200D221E|nr:EthD family reductase [Frankia sp. AgB32]MCK9893509.1 EthD family reductase [Frankia sp. AgB32]